MKDHADALAEPCGVHGAVIDILSVKVYLAGDPHGRDEVIHAVQRPQKRGFSAAGGTDEGSDLVGGNCDGHVPESVGLAVPEVQVFYIQYRFHRYPQFFFSFRPSRAAERLMSRVSSIRMEAMEKATAVSPRSLA